MICGTWYCVYEAVALLGLFGLWVISGAGAWMDAPRIQDAHYRLMAWWLRGLWSTAERTFHLTIAVEPATEPGPGPILVFSRHGGVANLMILLATLLLDYDLRPRVIMLDKFQWEPVLNALLNRIPNVFIARGPCIGRRQSTPSGRWREGWVPTMPSCSSRRATTSLSVGA